MNLNKLTKSKTLKKKISEKSKLVGEKVLKRTKSVTFEDHSHCDSQDNHDHVCRINELPV